MVNFHAPHTVPEKFRGRTFYQHNANVTLMRTTPEENAAIGADLGRKLASAAESTVIMLPARGVSAIDRAGQPFDDPAARAALFQSIRETCGQTPVIELDMHINDRQFAQAAAEKLLSLISARQPTR
jgi:uncharacterized protein (UPF0261 family)